MFTFSWLHQCESPIDWVSLHMVTSLKPLPVRRRDHWQGHAVSPSIEISFGSRYQEKVFWFGSQLGLKCLSSEYLGHAY